MANMMKAASYKILGGPDVLEILDLEVPEPGPGEVRVKVSVSGVNPSDWKARRNGRGGETRRATGSGAGRPAETQVLL